MRLLVSLIASTTLLLAACADGQMGAATAPPATTAAPTDMASAAVLSGPDDVRTVQIRLQQLKFYEGGPSGSWNVATEAAVQEFQRANGLAVGKLDQETLRAMGLGSIVMGNGRLTDVALLRGPRMMDHQATHHPMAGMAPAAGPGPGAHILTGRHLQPDSVRQVQQKLAEGGYYKASVDGVWGPRSQDALVAFQNSRSLSGTGRLTPETISALGIDPDTLQWRSRHGGARGA
ncbi:peptidoglycan-binding domain-containing protein [Desertibaculum subflavum]|uniref:peptidoglycan-binding domain-containing protein n=1 Tax=Desertibaculum subflavum TaxID=2268458 RepID=UPI0013C401F4